MWKALCTRGGQWGRPDIVVGASAGAWNGWSIAGGATPEELAREWLDPRTARVLQPGLHRTGVLRPEGLHGKARELFARYQPRMPFGLTIVELPRLRTRLVRDQEITWQHLAATCSIPLGFPPVRIHGRRYVDGGLAGALPLWAAEENGRHARHRGECLTTLPVPLLRRVLPLRRPSPALEVIPSSLPSRSARCAMRCAGRRRTSSAGWNWASETGIAPVVLRLQCRVYAALSDLSHEGTATAAVPLGAARRRLRFGEGPGITSSAAKWRRCTNTTRGGCCANRATPLAVGDLLENERRPVAHLQVCGLRAGRVGARRTEACPGRRPSRAVRPRLS